MNTRIWWTAIFYLLLESWYFGWNLVPKSDAELIADGIGLIILSLSYLKVRS